MANQTVIHRAFAPLKALTPGFLWKPVRCLATSVLTPLWFSYRTGHWRSSFRMAAVDRHGEPLPWYTYPCIHFLAGRDFRDLTVLEFGAGQSTIWWGRRAARVVAFEGDTDWYKQLLPRVGDNVRLFPASMDSAEACGESVRRAVREHGLGPFDVVVIDGLHRYGMIRPALELRSPGGVVIVDNAEGYDMHAGFAGSGLERVDFYGHAPGVLLPHCTSIFFAPFASMCPSRRQTKSATMSTRSVQLARK